MVNLKINNLKVYSPSINNIIRNDRYNADDVTEAELKFVKKHVKESRIPRMDLTPGDVVVVLEGAHCGKRVIFVEQLAECKAIVSGISSINGVSAFIIDERYLLKLSAKIEIPTGFSIERGLLYESKMYEQEKMEVEGNDSLKSFEDKLLSGVSKVPYMKSYLAEPFKVDDNLEFYSLNY